MLSNANFAANLHKAINSAKTGNSNEFDEFLKPAAVLAAFFKEEDIWKLLFIRRSNDLEFHRGEVAFPGGGKEESEKDLIQTALRETWEELGIDPEKISILGSLNEIPTKSNYRVTPVIGILDWPVSIQENPQEVSRTFSIPLDWLMEESNWSEKEIELPDNRHIRTIVYEVYEGEILWGLTAKITHQIIELIKKGER